MLKYSRQREAIKTFLMTRTDHPTADVIYQNLRQEYPNISLGTVYRNLTLLVSLGEIQKIQSPDSAEHFDGNVNPHLHICCSCCNKVEDIHGVELPDLTQSVSEHYDGQITGYSIYFQGLCKECMEKKMAQ